MVPFSTVWRTNRQHKKGDPHVHTKETAPQAPGRCGPHSAHSHANHVRAAEAEPEWLTETPVMEYSLGVWGPLDQSGSLLSTSPGDAEEVHKIKLTFDEYVFLKKELAMKRGIIDADGVVV